MASQGSSSNEVLTLISDVTDQDVVSEDVNVHYEKVTLPSGKMVTKCLFCDKICNVVLPILPVEPKIQIFFFI